ncbi:hypothetical protein ACHWQZ_G007936 [Mnemiopsis leidyi]
MWKIPNLNTTDIGVALNWKNPVFYTLAVVDGILIAIGLQGNLSVITRRHILTKTDDPLIRSTALADLMMVIFKIIPVFVTSLYRRWMLGGMVCAITAYGQYVPNIVELLLMTALPLQRLYVMKCPLSSLTNASKRRKLGIWLSIGLWTVVTAAVILLGLWNGKSGTDFSLPRLSCQPSRLKTSSSQGTVLMIVLLYGEAEVMLSDYNYMPTISLHLSFVNVVSNYYVYKYSNRRKEAQQQVPYPRSRSDIPAKPGNPLQAPTCNALSRYK